MTKPTQWVCAQTDQSSQCAQWVAKNPSFLHADSEDSHQTGRMPRLIWVFAGRTVILLVLSWGGLFLRRSVASVCLFVCFPCIYCHVWYSFSNQLSLLLQGIWCIERFRGPFPLSIWSNDHFSPFSCQLHHIAFERLKFHTPFPCPASQAINIFLSFNMSSSSLFSW